MEEHYVRREVCVPSRTRIPDPRDEVNPGTRSASDPGIVDSGVPGGDLSACVEAFWTSDGITKARKVTTQRCEGVI